MYFNKAFITKKKKKTTLVGNSFGTKTKKKSFGIFIVETVRRTVLFQGIFWVAY